MAFRTVIAALALLGSTSLIGGVYAEATPSDSVIDKLDITLDGVDGEGMGVNVKAHITSDVIDRLLSAGFTSLFSSEALAKPSGLKGGHGQGGGPPPPIPDPTSNLLPTDIILGAGSVISGGTLHVDWNLSNTGDAAVNSVSVTKVRITNSLFSPAGPDLDSVATGIIAGGSAQAESSDLVVALPPGTYYVWILANATGTVTNQSSSLDDNQHSFAFTVLPVVPPPPVNVANNVILTNKTNALVTNYPLQIGRPFVCGEIAHYPQILVNNAPITTQADVKNRCNDGSVKFAVISGVIPQLPIQGIATLTFQDQASGNNTALSQAAMLAPGFDFEATMNLAFTSGSSGNASARNMLNAGAYKLWTSGSVAQTIEIADDTAARAYDIGNGDGFHPFRPRFYATFWPTLNKVLVRYVGENGLSTELEDLKYTLTLTKGNVAPTSVYSINLRGEVGNNKLHWFTTRWTKQFWIGATPPNQININHNLAYLALTKYMPNFDTSLVVPEATIASQYAGWLAKTNDLYDATWNNKGIWQSGMGAPGARGEIAPYPAWNTYEIYTGDWRMREYSSGMSDLAAAYPANVREGSTTKRLQRSDPVGSGTGLGHAMSITDRKTLCLARLDLYNYVATLPSDKATIVGPFTQQWSYNQAHVPAPFFPRYVVTGDPWYLDEMYMWAAFDATQANGAVPTTSGGRGPTGAEGVTNLQLRGQGWSIRNRAEAVLASPDGTPERAWFTTLISDQLARWEGGLQITGTPLDGNPSKVWGALRGNYFTQNGGPFNLQVPTLHNWEANGNPTIANGTVEHNEALGIYQVGTVGNFTSPWMLMYDLYAFGRAQELGFPAAAIMSYTTGWFTTTILHTGVPKLIRVYQMPVEKAGGGYMTYPEIMNDGLTANYLNVQLPIEFASDLKPDGRTFWAAPGMAMAKDFGVSEINAAYAWYKTNVYDAIPNLNTNPKWAVIPRP